MEPNTSAPPIVTAQFLDAHMTTREAAEMLGCVQDHVNHLLIAGKLRGFKVAHMWFIEKQSVLDYAPPLSAGGRPRSRRPRA